MIKYVFELVNSYVLMIEEQCWLYGACSVIQQETPLSLREGELEIRHQLEVFFESESSTALFDHYLLTEGFKIGEDFSITNDNYEDFDQAFKPFLIEDSYWIVSENTPLLVNDGKRSLILSSKIPAFGIGNHPTTNMCLKSLISMNLNELTLLDFGSGTGILSLISAFQGAKKVYAIDNDKDALYATRYNRDLNAMNSTIWVGSLNDLPKHSFDVIVANVFLNVLLDYKYFFQEFLSQNGVVIFSGILKEQSKILIDHYRDIVFFEKESIQDEWAMLYGISR